MANGEDTRQLGERMAAVLRQLQQRSGVIYASTVTIVRDALGAVSSVSLRTCGKHDKSAPDSERWEELQREAQGALAELLAAHETETAMNFGDDFQIERDKDTGAIRKVSVMYDALA